MPLTAEHEYLIEFVRHRPSLVTSLLTEMGYADLVLMLLPESVAKKLYEELKVTVNVEDLEHLPFVREWVELGEARGEARGEAKGEAKAVLRFLSNRGVPVSHEAQERILTCTDQETLETWIDRAATATNVDELFD